MPPDPWRGLPNSFSNRSVENCPSRTYLWFVAKKCQHRLTIPSQVLCMAVAVSGIIVFYNYLN